MIVEEEKNEKDRAEYGKQLIKGLSKELNKLLESYFVRIKVT
jgi:hypothetical protein